MRAGDGRPAILIFFQQIKLLPEYALASYYV